MTAHDLSIVTLWAVIDRPYNASKLLQKPHIVLEEQLEIVDVVLQHRVTFDAAAESKTGVFLRVIVHEGVQIRMHHAGAHYFDPARLFAHAAAGAIAEDARDVHFSAWLDERKEARPQPCFCFLSEKLLMEPLQRSFQIRKCDALIHQQTLHLMEH